ncbi:hypothetical protein Y032_0045g1214 [Ancylostoma ceylanicum]|uniref:TIL domain-containing protein n=1 Tax=Ancylostoma ceylanicum TaxID=53326 RepID=A0A016UEI6_9BILA|nr:hypothetical protein Y032_0045g1214 [Ancylostoma ceylanicum]
MLHALQPTGADCTTMVTLYAIFIWFILKVPLSQCGRKPEDCRKTEEWNKCGQSCELKCRDYTLAKYIQLLRYEELCLTQCSFAMCTCKDNYARNQYGKCVPILECPPRDD